VLLNNKLRTRTRAEECGAKTAGNRRTDGARVFDGKRTGSIQSYHPWMTAVTRKRKGNPEASRAGAGQL